MSSTERAAREVKGLREEEMKVMLALERGAITIGPTDAGVISRLSSLPPERVEFAIRELRRKELVVRRGRNYTLTQSAVEALALSEYARRGMIVALGAIIARGKESDVYEAFDEKGGLYALKFFKLGRTSFTAVRRKRQPARGGIRSWLTMNYEAARREYTTLKRLEGLSVSFPVAVAYERSTVLLEQLSGVRLSTRPPLEDPRGMLIGILSEVRRAYIEAGVINADLSEYNILTDGSRFWLIDWPQAVERRHPNAPDLLRHDVLTVVRFFARAYGVRAESGAAMDYVVGRTLLEEDKLFPQD
jgi:RIO kinase 2